MKYVGFLRQVLVGNWPSRIYLGVVTAAMLLWLVVTLTWTQPDANMSGVSALLLTLPVSLMVLMASSDAPGHPELYVAAVVVGALVNDAVIGLVAYAARRSGPR
ncbi:SCO4225 family membrane protein [Streptacidiphilus jiangxiensis]|uniref:Uncharacterized protein n=1 Tax=Streptacidiphilus jiangxiensis TaxID=235985 RepID=A0A1H8AQ42_STRJI|nr:hypothetical protein [Streptacidiphilus jiangxiensis]SEM71637.1 hypothetical protein SAMN05414137_14711 [Streptacidiphilus jiangxiensis]